MEPLVSAKPAKEIGNTKKEIVKNLGTIRLIVNNIRKMAVDPDAFLQAIPPFKATVGSVVGFDCHPPPIPKVDHYVLWLARLSAARSTQLVFIEHDGPLEIKLHRNFYVKEHVNEIVFS